MAEFGLDFEVNEADAVEQAEVVDPDLVEEEEQDGSVPLDANPADVAEQRIEVHLPDDDDEER